MANYKVFKRLSSYENPEMNAVLDIYRLQTYVRIKSKLQPLPRPRDFNENSYALQQETRD